MLENINDFISYLKIVENKSLNTMKAYKRDLVEFSDFMQEKGIGDIQSVSKADILAFLEHLNQKGDGAATRSRKLSALKSFFAYLYSYDYISKEITRTIKAPKISKKLPVTATGEESEKIIEAAFQEGKCVFNKYRDKAIISIMFCAGLRRQEVLDLGINDIDIVSGRVLVHGKGDKQRLVYMNESCSKAVSDYLQERDALEEKDDGLLFVTMRGKKIMPAQINVIVNRARDAAGIDKHFTPHSCRKTCATLMSESGENIRTIQEVLGHSNIQTTTIYTAVSDKSREHAGRNFKLI